MPAANVTRWPDTSAALQSSAATAAAHAACIVCARYHAGERVRGHLGARVRSIRRHCQTHTLFALRWQRTEGQGHVGQREVDLLTDVD